MTNNPFSSITFNKIWSKHFNNSKEGESFNFIYNVSFIKNKYLPTYVNLGINLTNGINYELNDGHYDDYKRRVFVIRDIPSFLNVKEPHKTSNLRLKKIFQYDGYLRELDKIENIDDYMKSTFSQSRRKDIKRSFNRLESCFEITCKMYHGEIEKSKFDFIFQKHFELLEKRYTNKEERCGELENVKLWPYYSESTYHMILEKSASLFVVYNGDKPIGVRLIYHFEKTIALWLSIFDTDYYKFSLGKYVIYKLLEWCFDNGVTHIDFTHGDFEWKRKWSNNTTYQKHHHLLYDSSSIRSEALAFFIEKKFSFKRYLRDRKIIKKYHKIRYKISNISRIKMLEYINFNVEWVIDNIPSANEMELIDIYNNEFMSPRKAIFDYYYKYPERIMDVKFYKLKENNTIYYALGKEKILKIQKSHN